MFESEKWWAGVVGIAIISIAMVISLTILSGYSLDKQAVKYGMIQKVEQSRTVWTKP